MPSSRPQGVVAVHVMVFILAAGCSRGISDPKSSNGSNVTGVLTISRTPVPDAMLSVYRKGQPAERVAFAITDASGSFRLLTPDGLNDARLSAGAYSITVESQTGALNLPAPYSQPSRSPVEAHIAGPDASWNLELHPVQGVRKSIR